MDKYFVYNKIIIKAKDKEDAIDKFFNTYYPEAGNLTYRDIRDMTVETTIYRYVAYLELKVVTYDKFVKVIEDTIKGLIK